jgi:hypothetical protein
MNSINNRFSNKTQEAGIKPLQICIMILAILIFTSALGFTEDPEKVTISGIGTIDQIRDDEVVVNDSLFKLSPGVKFYTNSKMNTYANRSRFRKGTYIGYQFNGTREITAMWLESK